MLNQYQCSDDKPEGFFFYDEEELIDITGRYDRELTTILTDARIRLHDNIQSGGSITD